MKHFVYSVAVCATSAVVATVVIRALEKESRKRNWNLL